MQPQPNPAIGPFKDTTTPANWAMALIVLYFIVIVGLFGFFFFIGTTIETDPEFYFAVVDNTEQIERVATILSGVIYFVCGLCFAIWTYRVHANLSRFGGGIYQDNTSGMAGWSYFIPFVNLYLPWKIVTENWSNLQLIINRITGNASESNPLILPWWLFFIVASIIERVGGKFVEQNNESGVLAFAAIVLSIRLIAGILAIMMISKFIKTERRAKELASNPAETNNVYEALVTG